MGAEKLDESAIPKKILYVDDEESIRNLMNEYLFMFGFEVTIAVEGNDALDKVSKNQFDLIITDINMPNGMGGIEFINNLYKLQSKVPIFAVSGHIKNSEYVKDLPTEITFLEKPFSLETLLTTINKQFEKTKQ